MSSDPTTVTFSLGTQSALTITSLSGTVGTPLTLTTTGGSGNGAITFVATDGTATGCTVTGSRSQRDHRRHLHRHGHQGG